MVEGWGSNLQPVGRSCGAPGSRALRPRVRVRVRVRIRVRVRVRVKVRVSLVRSGRLAAVRRGAR